MMADEEKGRGTTPPQSAPSSHLDYGRPPSPPPPNYADTAPPAGVLPVNYNVASGSDAGRPTTVPASDSGPDAPPPPTIKAADAVAVGVSEARAQGVSIRLRPVEAMLRDPLGEVARKERRSLLGISAIAILVGWTGLVPAKIENFGITFAAPERKALLWVFVAVVVYYTLAFIIYSISDALSYGYAVYRGREELRKQNEEDSKNVMNAMRRETQPVVDSWRFVGLVTPASLARGLFDFIVPLLVAGLAIWSLVGGVTQVTTNPPAAPAKSEASPPQQKQVDPAHR